MTGRPMDPRDCYNFGHHWIAQLDGICDDCGHTYDPGEHVGFNRSVCVAHVSCIVRSESQAVAS